jgi:hypothetical protein
MFQFGWKDIFFVVLVVLSMIVVGSATILEKWIPEHVNRLLKGEV